MTGIDEVLAPDQREGIAEAANKTSAAIPSGLPRIRPKISRNSAAENLDTPARPSGCGSGPARSIELDRGAIGDPRASSSNDPINEFLGDYNSVAATDDGWVALFNDGRDAAVCPAIDASARKSSKASRGRSAGDGDAVPGDLRQHRHLVGERGGPDALRRH